MDNNKRSNIISWKNRDILIKGKSVFYHSLFDKGIMTLEDLISHTNKLLIKQNPNALALTPREWFQLIQIFDALPTQWRTSLTFCGPKSGKSLVLNDHTKLCLKNQVVQIEKSLFKEYLLGNSIKIRV